MKTSEQGFVLVREGDTFKITCNVKYHSQSNCYAEGLWHGSQNNALENQETQFENRSFTAILKIDENFINGSNYKFSVKFKCLKTQRTTAEYSTKEPIFETNFVTPTFYLRGKSCDVLGFVLYYLYSSNTEYTILNFSCNTLSYKIYFLFS